MDVEPVDQSRGRPIAESLEGRPNQDSSAVSLVEETARIFELQSILHDASAERIQLASDGALLTRCSDDTRP